MARVLVIDDDPELLHMVQMILERGGHTPIMMDDPEAVLDRIRKEKPDLLVVDIMMPALSGHDLTRQVRTTPDIADIPILVLTARAQPIDRKAALDSGADDYLSKPTTPQVLMEHIDQLLSGDRPPGGEPDSGVVIGLFGLRGGVGRTTLAVNLAATLRRANSAEVCLLELGTSGTQAVMHLRLQARTSWADLPPAQDMSWDDLRAQMLLHRSGLRLLASPRFPRFAAEPGSEAVEVMLGILRRHLDYVVVDLPPMLNGGVEAALERCDLILHVVTPDVVSVQMALHTRQALERSALTLEQQSFVLNQVQPEAALPVAAIETGLRARLDFRVGHDPNQVKALAQGVPLALTPATTPLAAGAHRLAEVVQQRFS